VTAAIETHQLTRTFPSGVAVDRLDLELASGEVLALLGPNGAGKTTTVRLLNGVLRPQVGWSRVLGIDPVADGDAVRSRTGVLTENAGLDDRLTTRENLEITARLRGFGAADARRRSQVLLERFGMAHRADDLTQGFSTGQRKRVALARALLHDPEVLFLDEPTSGLDPAGTRDVVTLIQDLADEGRTIVLATHFLGEAGRLADRMAVLHRGGLHAFGRPADLAAEIFDGVAARVDLGRPAEEAELARVRSLAGVLAAEAAGPGLDVRVVDRDVLPRLVRDLVAGGSDLFGFEARPPSLEDVYFAVERRILAEEGAAVTDGFYRSDEREVVPSSGPWVGGDDGGLSAAARGSSAP
jgi:ABC-2 type transport system ATP-binding protein